MSRQSALRVTYPLRHLKNVLSLLVQGPANERIQKLAAAKLLAKSSRRGFLKKIQKVRRHARFSQQLEDFTKRTG